MYYKRADGRTLKNHVNAIINVVGTVEKMQDATTATVLSQEPISAHIPGSLDLDIEVGEVYAFIATCVDDTTISVKSAVHVPKAEYDERVLKGLVDATEKYSEFFYY